jgi:hypothetical protein
LMRSISSGRLTGTRIPHYRAPRKQTEQRRTASAEKSNPVAASSRGRARATAVAWQLHEELVNLRRQAIKLSPVMLGQSTKPSFNIIFPSHVWICDECDWQW